MSEIWVVRHGQASLRAADYDQLSTLGEEQVRLMGTYYANLHKSWDRVIVGPKKRHRQTYEGIRSAYEAIGRPFPEAEVMPEFDEHSGASVVKKVLSKEKGVDQDGLLPSHIKTKDDERYYFERFQEISSSWASGELVDEDYESFAAFRERVTAGLRQLEEEAGTTSTCLVVCSGGPVATCAGHVLGLNDEEKMKLSWIVFNGAHVSFRFGKDRPLSVVQFNALPNFSEPRLITMI